MDRIRILWYCLTIHLLIYSSDGVTVSFPDVSKAPAASSYDMTSLSTGSLPMFNETLSSTSGEQTTNRGIRLQTTDTTTLPTTSGVATDTTDRDTDITTSRQSTSTGIRLQTTDTTTLPTTSGVATDTTDRDTDITTSRQSTSTAVTFANKTTLIDCARYCHKTPRCQYILYGFFPTESGNCGVGYNRLTRGELEVETNYHAFNMENKTLDGDVPECQSFLSLSYNEMRFVTSPMVVNQNKCKILVGSPGKDDLIRIKAKLLCNDNCTSNDVLVVSNIRYPLDQSNATSVCQHVNDSQSELTLLSAAGGYVMFEMRREKDSSASYNVSLSIVSQDNTTSRNFTDVCPDCSSSLLSANLNTTSCNFGLGDSTTGVTSTLESTTAFSTSDTPTASSGMANTSIAVTVTPDTQSPNVSDANITTTLISTQDIASDLTSASPSTFASSTARTTVDKNGTEIYNQTDGKNSNSSLPKVTGSDTRHTGKDKQLPESDSDSANAGVIAGSVVGGLLALLLLVAGSVLLYKHWRMNKVQPRPSSKLEHSILMEKPSTSSVPITTRPDTSPVDAWLSSQPETTTDQIGPSVSGE